MELDIIGHRKVNVDCIKPTLPEARNRVTELKATGQFAVIRRMPDGFKIYTRPRKEVS